VSEMKFSTLLLQLSLYFGTVNGSIAADPAIPSIDVPQRKDIDRRLNLQEYEHLPYVIFSPDFEDFAKGYWADMIVAIDKTGAVTFLPDFRINVTSELLDGSIEPFSIRRFHSSIAKSILSKATSDLASIAQDPELKDANETLKRVDLCLASDGCDLAESAQRLNSLLQIGQLQRLLRSFVVTQMDSGTRPFYASKTVVAQSRRYQLYDLSDRRMTDLQRLSLVDFLSEEGPTQNHVRYHFYTRLWDIGLSSLVQLDGKICSELSQLSELPPGTELFSVNAVDVTQDYDAGGSYELRAETASLTALPAFCDHSRF